MSAIVKNLVKDPGGGGGTVGGDVVADPVVAQDRDPPPQCRLDLASRGVGRVFIRNGGRSMAPSPTALCHKTVGLLLEMRFWWQNIFDCLVVQFASTHFSVGWFLCPHPNLCRDVSWGETTAL